MSRVSTGAPLTIALLYLRLYAGLALFSAGWGKVTGTFLDGAALSRSVRGWLDAGGTYDFFVPFLRDVVAPNARLFAWLVAWGELVGGACLAIGLLTRPAALGGLLLVVAIALAEGDPFWEAHTAVAFMPILVAVLLTNPGRVLGLDAWLGKRLPRWLA